MQLSHAVKGSEDPAFVVGPHGYITAWNDAAADVFDLPAGEALWARCHEVMRDTGICRADCAILAAAVQGHSPAAVDVDFHGKRIRLHHLGIAADGGATQVLHLASRRESRRQTDEREMFRAPRRGYAQAGAERRRS